MGVFWISRLLLSLKYSVLKLLKLLPRIHLLAPQSILNRLRHLQTPLSQPLQSHQTCNPARAIAIGPHTHAHIASPIIECHFQVLIALDHAIKNASNELGEEGVQQVEWQVRACRNAGGGFLHSWALFLSDNVYELGLESFDQVLQVLV